MASAQSQQNLFGRGRETHQQDEAEQEDRQTDRDREREGQQADEQQQYADEYHKPLHQALHAGKMKRSPSVLIGYTLFLKPIPEPGNFGCQGTGWRQVVEIVAKTLSQRDLLLLGQAFPRGKFSG
jgi:hypothetical protein